MCANKHKNEENLRTFGNVLELLEAFGKHFNAIRVPWERIGAFGRLGRQVIIIPCGMVW